MSFDPHRRGPDGRDEPAGRRAILARDAGLARISSVTRWTVAGAVALCGFFAVLADHAFRGHAVSRGPASNTAAQTPPASTPGSGTSDGLAPPSQAPVQTPAAPVAVSGGS